MSQQRPEGDDPRPETSGSSLGSSSLGGSSSEGSSLDGSSLDDAREAAARDQPSASPFSREAPLPSASSPEWPSYPPAAAAEPPPATPPYGSPPYGSTQYGQTQYGQPQYGQTPFGATPPYGGAAAPDPQGYPATPEYGYPSAGEYGSATPDHTTNPYEVNPYQSSYGGYSPYGYGAAPTQHPQSTAALVLGIVGVAVCPLAGIGGLVLGNRARKEIDAQPQRYSGRGLATAGRVLGIVSIVFLVLGVLFMSLGLSGAFDS